MISTRRAVLEDLAELTVLFDLYRIFYNRPSDIAAATRFLKERMENNESTVFIAELDGKAVGFVQLFPIFSSVGMQRCWLLNDLYVHASARQQGVAAQLLAAAKAFGVETKSRWLILETAPDNYTAQSVYEANGWKRMPGFFYELRLDE